MSRVYLCLCLCLCASIFFLGTCVVAVLVMGFSPDRGGELHKLGYLCCLWLCCCFFSQQRLSVFSRWLSSAAVFLFPCACFHSINGQFIFPLVAQHMHWLSFFVLIFFLGLPGTNLSLSLLPLLGWPISQKPFVVVLFSTCRIDVLLYFPWVCSPCSRPMDFLSVCSRCDFAVEDGAPTLQTFLVSLGSFHFPFAWPALIPCLIITHGIPRL